MRWNRTYTGDPGLSTLSWSPSILDRCLVKSKYINLRLKNFVKFIRTFSYKLFCRKIFRTLFFVLLITTRLSELARHCCVNGIVYCILESHLKAVPFLFLAFLTFSPWGTQKELFFSLSFSVAPSPPYQKCLSIDRDTKKAPFPSQKLSGLSRASCR